MSRNKVGKALEDLRSKIDDLEVNMSSNINLSGRELDDILNRVNRAIEEIDAADGAI